MAKLLIVIAFLPCFVHLVHPKTLKREYACLKAETIDSSQQFCMVYYPEFRKLPESPSLAVPINLVNATKSDGCSELDVRYDGKAALTIPTNACAFEDTIVNFNEANFAALIMSSSKPYFNEFNVNGTSYPDMVVGFVSKATTNTLLNLLSTGADIKVSMYSTYEVNFVYSSLIIWVIAVFTVTVGAYWSGKVRLELFILEQHQKSQYLRVVNGGNGFQENKISQSRSLQLPPIVDNQKHSSTCADTRQALERTKELSCQPRSEGEIQELQKLSEENLESSRRQLLEEKNEPDERPERFSAGLGENAIRSSTHPVGVENLPHCHVEFTVSEFPPPSVIELEGTTGSLKSGEAPGRDGIKARTLRNNTDSDALRQPPRPKSALDVSPLAVSLYVVYMGAMLLFLYFFSQYAVRIIIGFFSLLSVFSLIGVLGPIVDRIPIGTTRIPRNVLPRFLGTLQIRHLFLILFSIGVTTAWLVFRLKPWSWVLQDLLGVATLLFMLASVRLPNLRICSVLLILLFFYDIFFVFITPFLTLSGESIMVEVAKGVGDTQEQLPVAIRVPHVGFEPITVCLSFYSLLGFGDILMPGLLVSYCRAFDLLHRTRPSRLYYVASTIGYGIGLTVADVALRLSNTGQPALLYLVPCTLLPVVLIALCRGELRAMWEGNFHNPPVNVNGNPRPLSLPNNRVSLPYGAAQTDPAIMRISESSEIAEKSHPHPEIV